MPWYISYWCLINYVFLTNCCKYICITVVDGSMHWFTFYFAEICLCIIFREALLEILDSVLDEGLTWGTVGWAAAGFRRRYSRNVTATDAQLVALDSQQVPHGKASTLDLPWEGSGRWSGTKGERACGGAGWVRSGPQGWLWLWLCTLNAQTAFWEGMLTSFPLLWNKKQKQERKSQGLGALLHILHYIQC